MKRLKFLLPLLLVCLALTASLAWAQDRSVVVERRDADMTIQPDGSVDVVETWVVNLQGGPFRYAFRAIPLNRVSSIVFTGVSENGQDYMRAGSETPNTYTVEVGSGERTLKWYFPETTDATRTFELRYTLYDALRIYEDGDQFWWKFIEADRGYPIQSSRVTVHVPGEFELNQIAATTYLDAREAGGATVVDGQTVRFDGGPFPPDTEWEIRVGFPHGVVTQSVPPWQAIDDQRAIEAERAAQAEQQFDFYSLWASLLILIGGGLALLVLWYVRGRDQAVGLAAEFLNAPPDDPPGSGHVLTPALAGTLLDEEANVRDVLATLIDWAARGIITIRALPKGAKTPDPNDDYAFERRGGDAPPLQYAYERELMSRLWQGETRRNMGYIRNKFTGALKDMFDSLYDELVRDGYFPARPDRVRAQFYRYGWLLLVLLCPAACLFQFFVDVLVSSNAVFSFAALAPWLALGVVSLALLFLSRYMPQKTRKGTEAAARWNAFKRYLEHVEQYTNVSEAKEQFEKYLPYAVAFGLDKTWVEKFAAVDTPAPTWYTAPRVSVPSVSFDTRASSSTWSETRVSSSSPSPSTAAPASAPRSEGGGIGAPSLNSAASGAFTSLNNVSASFFAMLNTTAKSFVASNPTSSPRSSSFRASDSGSSWGSSSSFSSSFGTSFGGSSGGSSGGGGGGGGSSGFG